MSNEIAIIVGQGYVGLPLAMRAVAAGYEVIGYDVDEARVAALTSGTSFVEDISDHDVAEALATGRYRAVSTLAGLARFDVAIITVPTPLRESIPDLTFIDKAGADLAPLLTPGATVVLESTTYPGTTEERLAPILAAGSGLRAGEDFHLGYSPERIDPGNQTYTLVNTPKVVSGVDAASLAAVRLFYDRIVETTVPVSTPKEAELTKLLENTFRHVNIALVNELAMFAHDLGIDVWEAIDAASTKPFGYLRFTPGPGVGGHCLPVDPSYLSWQVKRRLGQSFRFVELANDVNEHMPDYVVRRLFSALNDQGKPIRGSRILLLGISFKANVGDWRESPSHRVAHLLADLGAELVAADPHVASDRFPAGVRPVEATPEEIASADAVVLLVDHAAFDPAVIVAHARYVLDTKARLPHAANVERL
ncbi:MAG: nucleotide sugar dehydrogenase [Acidimicrobiia bacterium]|nr:nucleotide sugar dehydrogenase [Acidimicrobiia bacterium]